MPVSLRQDNNIGYIEFDNKEEKVNILKGEVLNKLDKLLDEVKSHKVLKALIIRSLKPDVFIAGADISEIEDITDPKDGAAKAKAGQDIFNKIEDLEIPTFAVIDGVALGGGCELALACDYRILTFNDKTRIGLPEVNLGFVPGFGGTYRLPRIVGLMEGMKMILTGAPIKPDKAFKIGLADVVYPSNGLDAQVRAYVDDVLSSDKKKNKYNPKKKRGLMAALMRSRLGHMLIFNGSRKGVMQKTQGHFPAPLKAIEVVKQNYYCGRDRGMQIERDGFGELAVTEVSKICIHLFYLFEKYRKLKLEGADDVKPLPLNRVGVLGAGIMGGGIAQLVSARGMWARLKDINFDALAQGYRAAADVYKKAAKRRKMTKAEAKNGMARITSTLDYSGFSQLDIVIEAVVENMDIKKKVFEELSGVVSDKTILATNTSALSVTEMGSVTKDPSKVIGFHFFNPVHRMPLVEIITSEKTSKETIVTALDLVKRLGKTPILCKDSCGFVVNRILLGYVNEAGRLLEENGQMESIDKALVRFGMPMGPFTLSDEVGLDVGIKVLQILEEAFGDRYKPVKVFEKVYEKKFLGKKSGKGFYIHSGKKRASNPEINGLYKSHGHPFDSNECVDRLIYIMINEAARCLEDGIVDDPGAIDVGMIMGTGFPPFRGGLLKYADNLGIDHVIKRLEEFDQKFGDKRFEPSPYLVKLKSANKDFFSDFKR